MKTAVEFLKDGHSFRVGDIRLGVVGQTVVVAGWSRYTSIEHLTRLKALEELEWTRTSFLEMIDASAELKNFIADKEVEYVLYFDDYGKGSVVICSEKNGRVRWELES